MKNKVLKEAIIMFLLIIVMIFTMTILFYDSMTENVEDIIGAQYATGETVEEILKDISQNGGNEQKPNSSDSLLKSYSITADDLNATNGNNFRFFSEILRYEVGGRLFFKNIIGNILG